jgi:hypothetical protein
MSASKLIAIVCIVLCGALGGYASIFRAIHYGFFDALRTCTSAVDAVREQCILPRATHIPAYTSTHSMDSRLAVLFEFFAQGLTYKPGAAESKLAALLTLGYLAAQLGGAWYLIVLEGMRKGNAGGILSQYVSHDDQIVLQMLKPRTKYR